MTTQKGHPYIKLSVFICSKTSMLRVTFKYSLHKFSDTLADTATWRSDTVLIRQRVFNFKYLSCKICFNVLNYVFILFIFNLYCLVDE